MGEIKIRKVIGNLLFLLILGRSVLVYSGVTLTLTTYNVNLMPEIPFVGVTSNLNNPNFRAKNIPPYLKGNDVVACQEAMGSNSRKILDDGMRTEELIYQTPNLSPPLWALLRLKFICGGVKLYSKCPFSAEPKLFYFDRSFGLEGFGNKGIVYVPIEKEDMKFNIFATHMQSVNIGSPEESQQSVVLKEHINQFSEFVDSLEIPANEPVIYMGDFNCNGGSACTTTNSDDIYGVNKHPLYDDLLDKLNAEPVAKYDVTSEPFSFDPFENKMAKGKSSHGETLDHILCSKAHKRPAYGSTSILKIEHENPSGINELSDHYPVQAMLTFDADE
jgi:endonuclease/exonuclease/phosphatase family metal-dependent hydrolase